MGMGIPISHWEKIMTDVALDSKGLQVAVGDRVEFQDMGTVAGLVVRVDPPKHSTDKSRLILSINRDDGKAGGGPNGEWRVYADTVTVLGMSASGAWGAAPIPVNKPASKPQSGHKMGLDPELLDMDAFREFMKGL
jgi:hypothetical protein